MSLYFSKSKFVSACTSCNKYAWLDLNKPEEKSPVDEFAQSLIESGHKVGELAKEYFNADVDVTFLKQSGSPDLDKMIYETEIHLKLGTKVIAEASFNFGGLFCSVDLLVNNGGGKYSIYEVKSSTNEKPTKKDPIGVKDEHKLDAAYQKYVLENCGVTIDKVYVVLLDRDYVRGKMLELDKYFKICDITEEADALQKYVADKIAELRSVISEVDEPKTEFIKNCNGCSYWSYCSEGKKSPSPFDVYNLDFSEKCKLYNEGVSFFDVPKYAKKIKTAALRQIEYYNRPNDAYIEKDRIKEFLDELIYPVYSLDFETYQAVVPEYEGIKTYEQVPFQYSLHIVKKPDADIGEGSSDIEDHHFLDLSGADTRRAIAESLVKNIPYGAQVMAYHESTERNIVARLAAYCPDLSDHLLSFTYKDPLKIFSGGSYYVKAMGKKFSLKSVAPALYPEDKDMNYLNLEGDVKNGTQAMNAYLKAKDLTEKEREQLSTDLEKYCALDTLAVVKILKKLYEVSI